MLQSWLMCVTRWLCCRRLRRLRSRCRLHLALWDELYEINADLWVIQDDIRAFEAKSDFGPGFIGLARAVYVTNVERARVKKNINLLLGSQIVEEKSYTEFGNPS